MGIGSLSLTPTFDSSKFEYTTSTQNTSNKVTAAATNAGATVTLKANDEEIESGDTVTWEDGENVVEADVSETVSGQTVNKTYTVTVTKS